MLPDTQACPPPQMTCRMEFRMELKVLSVCAAMLHEEGGLSPQENTGCVKRLPALSSPPFLEMSTTEFCLNCNDQAVQDQLLQYLQPGTTQWCLPPWMNKISWGSHELYLISHNRLKMCEFSSPAPYLLQMLYRELQMIRPPGANSQHTKALLTMQRRLHC